MKPKNIEEDLKSLVTYMKYFKKNYWRNHLLTPGPVVLIREIETRCSANPKIYPLLEAFDYNKTEISLSLWLYCISLVGLFITTSLLLGVIFLGLNPWFSLSIPLQSMLLIVQIGWFETTINEFSYQLLHTCKIIKIQNLAQGDET